MTSKLRESPPTIGPPMTQRVRGNIELNQIEEWLRGLGSAFDVELVENDHRMVLVSRPVQSATPE